MNGHPRTLDVGLNGNYNLAALVTSTGSVALYSMVQASDGQIVVAGTWTGTADFDPGFGQSSRTATSGVGDVYVARYTTTGALLNVTSFTGATNIQAWNVTTDAAGNAYVVGQFGGTISGPFGSVASNGSIDAFAWKVDASGNSQWLKRLGGAGDDSARNASVDPATGHLLVVGGFSGSNVDFDPGAGTILKSSTGQHDAYLWELDPSGNYVSDRTWGSTGDEYAFTAVADNQGNTYVTSQFANTVDFDPGAGLSNLTSLGGLDTAITKFNADKSFAWVHQAGSTAGDDIGLRVLMDSSGNLIAAGTYSGTSERQPTSVAQAQYS